MLSVADEEGWAEKLRPIITLKNSTRPGDVERAINRALNFVQAHQFRLFIARTIRSLTSMTEEEFQYYLYPETKSKDGVTTSKLSTRALADLASAMEKAQSMSYLALNDTSSDRARRAEDANEGETSASDLHIKLAQAMSSAGLSETPRAKLLDAQIEVGKVVVAERLSRLPTAKPEKPGNPNDNDDH